MAILTPTDITGVITFVGCVADRGASLRSVATDRVTVGFEGFAGECHSGLTRPSCSRVTAQYPRKGTQIRNTRQISLVSDEELKQTAERLGIAVLPPEWVGANLVIVGVPMMTLLPPASRLVFDGGVVLTVDVENAPCQFPAREIEAEHPGKGKGYKAAATGRRGLTAWVERPGEIRLGARLRLHVPPQRPYPPLTLI